jgi:hypothetical protein
MTLTLSDETLRLAGILLLTIVAIESGGQFLLRLATARQEATDIQRTFFRAGHAHAGVFVSLGLICQLYADAAGLDGVAEAVARQGVPLAAILIPAGFFLSVVKPGATEPNRLVWLIHAGALSLAAGVVALGLGLLTA